MKISLSWLSEYTPVTLGAAELAERLTLAGLAVDAVVDRYDFLEAVRVGRITDVRPHPQADRLSLCRVDSGRGVLSVVCGAPNVRPGLLAPLALPGAVLPDERRIEAGVIRGERSEGMLCSAAELGLGSDAERIMELEGRLPVGAALNRALGLSDPVLEIDLTPNRADCLSVFGIAREVAAIQKTRLMRPETRVKDFDDRITSVTSVAIEAPDHCPRYVARVLENVAVGPSPFWLQDRLLSVGLRPINNIVDVTNFVMLECGQPLHAFDLERLAEQRIVVRTAHAGERFVTLDHRERALDPEMLMICDGAKPVAIAGVMGGLNSEIHGATTRVLIESACFDPVSVRRTSKKLGLTTDASRRFERGVDPAGTVAAADRAAALMAEVAGAAIVGGRIDAHPRPWAPKPIRLSLRRTARLLGRRVNRRQAMHVLRSIDFQVRETADKDELLVTAPSWRVDVSRPEDLMEEVARLSGFEGIPTTYPSLPVGSRPKAARVELRRRIADLLCGLGFAEVITYSFIGAGDVDRLRLPSSDRRRRTVAVLNPLAEDQAVMRSSLLPGLFEALRFNLSQQNRRVKIFEIGKTFIQKNTADLPEEPEMVAALWSGARSAPSWHGKEVPCDFYDLKGSLEALLAALRCEETRFTALAPEECTATRPGRTARILAGERELGLIGEVHPLVAAAWDLKQPAFVFELDLGRLEQRIAETAYRLRLPKFPAVYRDITVIVDARCEYEEIRRFIEGLGVTLLESVHLFDVFTGDPIPAGKRSLSFRMVYRSPDKTLEEADVHALHQSITGRIVEAFRADLPG